MATSRGSTTSTGATRPRSSSPRTRPLGAWAASSRTHPGSCRAGSTGCSGGIWHASEPQGACH
eukprot:12399498-Alexandrium_andersonii.AAC.1